jgi:5-methylcytosine-specific restriction endonuclease McrA
MPTNYLGSLEQQQKAAAWSNATSTGHWSVKIDCDGRIIRWEEYGMLSDSGWQMDHVVPRILGGTDALSNLRARHWRGNSIAGGHLGALRNVVRKTG